MAKPRIRDLIKAKRQELRSVKPGSRARLWSRLKALEKAQTIRRECKKAA